MPKSNKFRVGDYTVFWDSPPSKAALAMMWQELETRADGSFYQSWRYISCLFDQRFPNPMLLRLDRNNEVVALALFNLTTQCGVVKSLYLHETGTAGWDSVFVEHNGPLCARDTTGVRAACFVALLQCVGRAPGLPAQLRLSGIGDSSLAAARAVGVVRLEVTRPAMAVNLVALRANAEDYMTQLSSNTRYQLRRSMRRYHESGPITVTRAQSLAEADSYLRALVDLHQKTWNSRGKPGTFANIEFQRFHEALIAIGVLDGSVDILKISAGDRTIGYLLNFLYQGHVYAYQSGFDYTDMHPHEKPGLTCHAAAITKYLGEGRSMYDFLGGPDRYKSSMGDHSYNLHWAWLTPRWSALAGIYRLKSLLESNRQ